MTAIFLKLLNMSISASYLVLAVMLIRVLLPKTPKWIHCILWGIVAIRLLLPVSWESAWSLIPSAEVIPRDIAISQTPAINSGFPVVNSAINPVLTEQTLRSQSLLGDVLSGLSALWLCGIAVLVLYFIISCLVMRWRFRTFLSLQKGIRICDNVDSPFVLGILFPTIYLPSGMDPQEMEYVLAHEKAHIRRRDHWWKPLGYLLLAVYWFNPLLWVAYILLCRDIEQACDEKVIAQMDSTGKKAYSRALLSCSVHRRTILACPVAFGEIGIKSRINAVLSYKKASFWILMVSAVACTVAAVCFLSDPIPCQHEYRSQITTAATCTKHGIQTNTCVHCRHSYTQSVALSSHSYDAGTVTQESTCTQAGVLTLHCTACDANQTQSIALAAHTAGAPYGLKEPDCIHTGQETATCAQCREVFVTQTLAANDIHLWEETIVQKPTCTSEGEGIRTCSVCGDTEKCTYDPLGHHYKRELAEEATCNSRAQYKVFCSGCGDYRFELGNHGFHEWEYYSSSCSKCKHCGMLGASGNCSLIDVPTSWPTQTPTVIRWDIDPTP